MNNIKKRLDKLSKNKVYKICQKMKVNCKPMHTKKEMISKLLLPFLHKYRMKPEADKIDFSDLKIGGNRNINKHLNNLKGTPQITIGLPLRDLPRLFEQKYMDQAFKIGQRTKTKKMFKTLYQNMEQLTDYRYTIAQHKGTDAYGLAVLVNSYINMFMSKHNFDGNTGMKGLPLFMSRNSFSDLYQALTLDSKKLFYQFVMEAKEKIPKLVLYIYLDSDSNCGRQFPLLATDWLDSIINPDFDKRYEIIKDFKKAQKRSCIYKKPFKVKDDKFRKKDLMSPPIPYISWVGQYDQRYSMGALKIEYTAGNDIKIILECRECIGGADPTTLNIFKEYGITFIKWFTYFARNNKFGYNLSDYTIGFEYELSTGSKNTDSVMVYTHAWDNITINSDGRTIFKKFPLGTTGQMHFDFADKPGMVHEYVSLPFNLENGEYTFTKFIDDIFNYDRVKAIVYFSKKRKLKRLNIKKLREKLSKITTDKTMKTRKKIISYILKYEMRK